jgi:hypothetical protein
VPGRALVPDRAEPLGRALPDGRALPLAEGPGPGDGETEGAVPSRLAWALGTGMVEDGCGGTLMAGACDCSPTRLPVMAAASIVEARPTSQPRPRRRRPRVPDWSTKTGAASAGAATGSADSTGIGTDAGIAGATA